jgi:hypothetical protein
MHSTSTRRPLLPCSFEGCEGQFRTKSALTKHQRTFHLLDSGPSHLRTSLPPDKSNRLFCHVSGCLRSFKTKGALTRHLRSHNSSHLAPVTAPSSLIDAEPSMESHSGGSPPRTPLSPDNPSQFPQHSPANDQMDVDGEPDGVDFPYHNDDNSMRSNAPRPTYGNPSPVGVNPSVTYADNVKRLYHPQINGMFVQIVSVISQLMGYQGCPVMSMATTSTPQRHHLIVKLMIHTTGLHTAPDWSLKLLIFWFHAVKCRVTISTLFSSSGQIH